MTLQDQLSQQHSDALESYRQQVARYETDAELLDAAWSTLAACIGKFILEQSDETMLPMSMAIVEMNTLVERFGKPDTSV